MRQESKTGVYIRVVADSGDYEPLALDSMTTSELDRWLESIDKEAAKTFLRFMCIWARDLPVEGE